MSTREYRYLMLAWAGVLLVVFWPREAPVRPWFWRGVMHGAQAGAYQLGQLGMRAELRYRQEVAP